VPCLRGEVDASVAHLLDAEYVDPNAVLPGKDQRHCQQSIAKAAGKVFATKDLGLLAACQATLESGGVAACPEPKSAKSIATAGGKLASAIRKACSDTIVSSLGGGFGGSCAGAATASALADCEHADHADEVGRLLTLLP
jgi:hypothetical protein